jgi:hypothetical protein
MNRLSDEDVSNLAVLGLVDDEDESALFPNFLAYSACWFPIIETGRASCYHMLNMLSLFILHNPP